MFLKASTVGILLCSFFAVLVPFSHAEAAGEGVHAWDNPYRRPGGTIYRKVYSSVLDDPYFQRTETHALHPYYRNNYSTFLSVQPGGVTDVQRKMFLTGFPYYRVPSATRCSNYSYVRENYRTPPREFRCDRF